MRDSIRLGRIAGIPVGVHWSLLVIGVLLTVQLAEGLPGTTGAVTILVGAAAAIGLFASVLAHELGHSVVARRAGVRVEGITLWLLGGVARIPGEFPDARAQLRVALAGPLVSVALALGFGAATVIGGALALPEVLVAALGWLALVNAVVTVFNLVPAAPLDGGRILAAVLWMRHGDREGATISAAGAGRVFGWVLIGGGLVGMLNGANTIWPALLGLFVLAAADAERRMAQQRRQARTIA
jgi:Zn-dependent protease